MTIGNVTIGSDVEFFVRSQETGEIVSAEGFVLGTKRTPYRFDEQEQGFATQLDNVLAEGNIPPVDAASRFVGALTYLRKHLDKTLAVHGLMTVAQGAAVLDEKYLLTEQARNFGCEPSINAWTSEEEPVVSNNPNLRSAGFHIHVGYDPKRVATNLALGKMMDLYLGVPAILLDPFAKQRIEGGYGKAGNIRHQPHGCEYRTLSSYFVSDPGLISWAYSNTMLAIKAAESEARPVYAAQDAINGADKSLAGALVKAYGVPMP